LTGRTHRGLALEARALARSLAGNLKQARPKVRTWSLFLWKARTCHTICMCWREPVNWHRTEALDLDNVADNWCHTQRAIASTSQIVARLTCIGDYSQDAKCAIPGKPESKDLTCSTTLQAGRKLIGTSNLGSPMRLKEWSH
jgi:hypothetical protein